MSPISAPFDLFGKNYNRSAWFKEVMEKKIYISDVFLGFRQVPHFIIAVKGEDGEDSYILRATVNAARFGSMVENVRLGTDRRVLLSVRKGSFKPVPRGWADYG